MPKLQFSIVLQANHDQLITIATDYENLSKYEGYLPTSGWSGDKKEK
jgi:hypothetical protein